MFLFVYHPPWTASSGSWSTCLRIALVLLKLTRWYWHWLRCGWRKTHILSGISQRWVSALQRRVVCALRGWLGSYRSTATLLKNQNATRSKSVRRLKRWHGSAYEKMRREELSAGSIDSQCGNRCDGAQGMTTKTGSLFCRFLLAQFWFIFRTKIVLKLKTRDRRFEIMFCIRFFFPSPSINVRAAFFCCQHCRV